YVRQDVYTRMEWQRKKDGKRTVWVYVPIKETRYVTSTFLNYVEVNFDTDPVVSETNKLATNKFNVFFLKRDNKGFFTESGIPISQILKQCEEDESFRMKCCIVIPEYDFIISNKAHYVGAFVYKCPLPGLIPSRFP